MEMSIILLRELFGLIIVGMEINEASEIGDFKHVNS